MGRVAGYLLVPEAITHFIGASNYCLVYFWNGKQQLFARSLAQINRDLPCLVRIHKTALVNPIYVEKVLSPSKSKANGSVILKNGIELPISRRRWPAIAELLVPPDKEN
jgi:DNA-binding LytR/AlgR family response regulator